MPHIRGWVDRKVVGRRRVVGLMMPSDTGNQAVCRVGKTDGHSSPDHTTRRTDVEWNSLEP